MKSQMWVGEVSGQLDIPVRTIQQWVEKGLVVPEKGTRGTGDKCVYDVQNVLDIYTIKILTTAGMNLKMVKMIFKLSREREGVECQSV